MLLSQNNISTGKFVGLKICGMDCTLFAEWKSPSKIIARTGPGKGKGDVIVITKSGGKGSCTVGFRGYFLQIGEKDAYCVCHIMVLSWATDCKILHKCCILNK